MILKIKLFLCYFIYLPQIIAYNNSPIKDIIIQDIDRWIKECVSSFLDKSPTYKLIWLLFMKQQFRNLFYFRCRNILNVFKKICPPDPTIAIANDDNDIAGGGIYFEHAICARIAAKSIGYGCTFRQLTTIGVKSGNRHSEKVTIGDNVDFGVNVTAIGNIKIGNNAIIGAGSVVIKDVPENAIVAGNPAKIIRYRN